MDKISGIILDVYDDLGGSVLKTIFPTADALPEFVKSAHAISFDERSALPDDAFALILEQGGIELKKFATIDAGNTALSVEYFLKTAHRLPVEAQKVAAQNLVAACGWYDIEAPEELRKVAVSDAWIKRMVTSGVKKNRARKGGNDVQEFSRRMENLGGKKRRVAYKAAVKAQDSVASRRYEWSVADHLRNHAHQIAQGVTTGGGAAAGGVGVARAMGALPKKQSDESEKKKKKPSTEKVAATGVERLGARVEEVGHDWEGKGKTMRNVGYGGAVGLGAGSFMPKSKAVRVAMRVGAAAGALGGYVGEGGIRSGKGYQRAGREMQGLPVNQHDVAGFHYSPAAYNEAHRSGEAQRKFDALSAEHTEAKKKVAFGVSTAINLASVPGSVGEVRSNQQKQRAFQSQTGTIATPNQLAGM